MSTHKTLKEFEKIYKDTYKVTLNYLISRCSNLDDVNDMIQEIYIDFYRILKENKKIKDKQAFILGIANNKLKKYIDSKSKIATISIFRQEENKEVIIDIDSGINIEADFINKMNIDAIWSYLKTKDITIAKIFYFYFVLEMTLKEIAQELCQNESTIKSSLYRMLKKLKKDFGGVKIE